MSQALTHWGMTQAGAMTVTVMEQVSGKRVWSWADGRIKTGEARGLRCGRVVCRDDLRAKAYD